MNLFRCLMKCPKRLSFRLTPGFVMLTLALAFILPMGMADPAWPEGSVLVLYDSSGPEGWMGQLYVQHLTNLLSHFEVKVENKPVEQYDAGDINQHQTTLYLGVVYDNPLPAAFKSDFLASANTVCWLGYNLWQVAWGNSQTAFQQKFALDFLGLDFSPWSEVHYRGKILTRQTVEPEIGMIQVLDPLRVSVIATCLNGDQEAPYITRAGNLWYVGDNPLSYVTMTDRYLAFADILHDILNISHPESHRALLRIEDVSPLADPELLRAIADYLNSQNVPFLVCVIPEYRDPLGTYNSGVPKTVKLEDSPAVVNALRYMVARGGQIVLHGLTHQYDTVVNPYSGVSAQDYEFYLVTLDAGGKVVLQRPVTEDSAAWARERVSQGKSRLAMLNLNPMAWNTPHYLASVTDYQEFAKLFPISLDRGAYFATDADGNQQCLQQMAPYLIQKDVYGIKRLPENLGYIDPNGLPGQPPSLPSDLINRAQANLVVRDGWASCYFHWYLDLNYLKELVPGLKDQGYQFIRVTPPGTVAPILQLLLDDSAG